MRKHPVWIALLLVIPWPNAIGQIKRTEVPLGDALNKALDRSSLTQSGDRPFHIRVIVSEPENPQSPYQGTIEEWWVSPEQWRREATDKQGMRQTIVVNGGKKSEKDEGDYFPLWLRMFVKGLFYPVPDPDVAAWKASGTMIEQITMPNGAKSTACARTQTKVGPLSMFSNVCFDDQSRLDFYGSPGYDMSFKDYQKFGKKEIARKLSNDPEPGTALLGQVVVLEDEVKSRAGVDTFAPLPTNDDRFESLKMSVEEMTPLSEGNPAIVWPTVTSGKLSGHIVLYVATDTAGHVREAWPLSTDNLDLDVAREQVMKWSLKPTLVNGRPIQVEGGLRLDFVTTQGEPIPHLSDAEVRQLAIEMADPVWPAGAQRGSVCEVEISVDEQGSVAGYRTLHVPDELVFPVIHALQQWQFRPLIRNAKPQFFQGTVRLIVP